MKKIVFILCLFILSCNSKSDIPREYRPGLPTQNEPPVIPPTPNPQVEKIPITVSSGAVFSSGSQVSMRARINPTKRKLQGNDVKASVNIK